MKLFPSVKHLMVWVAALGCCLPASLATADPNASQLANQRTQPTNNDPPSVADVAIQPNGELVGQVTNTQGQPQANILVSIRRGSNEIAQARTDADGKFAVQNLRGGIYQVVAGEGTQMCRVWSDRTAPPIAKPALLVVSDSKAVLAQYNPGGVGGFFEETKYALTNPLVIGGIIATAVAIPIAIHNSNSSSSGS